MSVGVGRTWDDCEAGDPRNDHLPIFGAKEEVRQTGHFGVITFLLALPWAGGLGVACLTDIHNEDRKVVGV